MRRWLLTDFGFSTIVESEGVAFSCQRRGTDTYRAPELAEFTYDTSGNSRPGIVSKESDIWAVGCILFQVATTNNSRAFQSDHHAIGFRKGWEGYEIPQLNELHNVNLGQGIACPELGSCESMPLWMHLNFILFKCFAREPRDRASAYELMEYFQGWRRVILTAS